MSCSHCPCFTVWLLLWLFWLSLFQNRCEVASSVWHLMHAECVCCLSPSVQLWEFARSLGVDGNNFILFIVSPASLQSDRQRWSWLKWWCSSVSFVSCNKLKAPLLICNFKAKRHRKERDYLFFLNLFIERCRGKQNHSLQLVRHQLVDAASLLPVGWTTTNCLLILIIWNDTAGAKVKYYFVIIQIFSIFGSFETEATFSK